MANTGKDASGTDFYIWSPFGESGIDNSNAIAFGSVLGFNRNASKQVPTLDTSTPANNRPLPVVLLSGDGGAPYTSIPVVLNNFVNTSVQVETDLTSTGSTTSRQLGLAGYSKGSYQVDVTSIGTNVVVRVEASNNGTGWANISGDQTLTANGTYLISFDGILAANIRLTLVSISGGTPSVAASLLRGN